MKKVIILSALLLSFMIPANAQDILGGEITYRHLSGRNYEFNVFLYSKTSIGDDHTSINFNFGDGGFKTLTAISTTSSGDVTKWCYPTTHTYSGDGAYSLLLADSFRLANISNIQGSTAENIYLSAELMIDAGIGNNSSPTFLNNPVTGNNGITFIFNPRVTDADGDSLSYSLVPASSSNYSFPAGATIDPVNGNFQMPFVPGDFVINIQIEEWRNNILIGRIYREMLVGESNTVGLADHSVKDVNLKIFPNPANNYLILESNTAILTTIIFETSGKQVMHLENINLEKVEVNISQLEAGVYILKISAGSGIEHFKRIVIQ